MSPEARSRRIGTLAALSVVGALWVAALLAAAGRHARWQEMADRRARIEQMSLAEQEQLRRHLTRFAAMSPVEQQRLRQLHRAIQDHPQSEQLERVMRRYCEWLKTLEPFQREELRQLPARERLARVSRRLEEQDNRIARGLGFRGPRPGGFVQRLMQSEGFRTWIELTDQDRKVLRRWLDSLVKQLMEDPPAAIRERLAAIDGEDAKRRLVIGNLFGHRGGSPLPSGALGELRRQLSPKARAFLQRRDEQAQRRLANEWIGLLIWHEVVRRRMGPVPLVLPSVSDEELAQFLEKNLSPEQRERLLGLPPDAMARQLRMLYFKEKVGPSSGRSRSPRGRHPGPDWRGHRPPRAASKAQPKPSPPHSGKDP
ncbi:MAG TPA: hypothetical protein EYH34_07940 [Planctomycetes bacterium]|nr:hypothetical protein [Planctomycetota bacterium]